MVRVDIQDTLNLISNYNETLLKEDEILLMLNMHIRKGASQKNISEDEALQILQMNFESFRKKWASIFIKMQLEQVRIKESSVPTYLNEYRYSVKGIEKIYKDIVLKKISRKTINDHMTPDQYGFSKLKRISLPNEYNSVLESNLLEYFFNVTGKKIDPAKIRKYHYKAPVTYN